MASSKRKKLTTSILSCFMVLILSASSLFVAYAADMTASEAIAKIVYFAGNDDPNVPLEVLKATGVKRVVDAYIAAYGTAIANKGSIDVDTLEEIQALVDAVNKTETIARIKVYAKTDNASSLSIDELQYAGVTTALDIYLEDYKTAIAGKNEGDVDTTTKIQSVINAVNTAKSGDAVNKIKTAAGTAAADTLTYLDFQKACIVGLISDTVDAAYLNKYRAKVKAAKSADVDSIAKIQALVDAANVEVRESKRVTAIAKIVLAAAEDYMGADPDKAISIQDLIDAGVSSDVAKSEYLGFYQKAIADSGASQVDTTEKIKALIASVNTQVTNAIEAKKAAIKIIADFAANDDATGLTKEILLAGGVLESNIKDVNFGDHNADITKSTGYRKVIEALKRSDVEAVGFDLNSVIANANISISDTNINTLKTYAGTADVSKITISMLLSIVNKADEGKVSANNLDFYRANIKGKAAADVSSAALVTALIVKINGAVTAIMNYAAKDGKDVTLTVENLTDAGVSSVIVGNLDGYKAKIKDLNAGDVDTLAEIQSVINSVNANQDLSEAINVIKSKAGLVNSLTIAQFKAAGATNVIEKYELFYQQAVTAVTDPEKLKTKDLIQALIDSVNTREAAVYNISIYAANDDASALTIAELKTAGVTGVVDANLDLYKKAIKDAKMSEANTVELIQIIVNTVNSAAIKTVLDTIADYAQNDNASNLTIEQLKFIGLSNVIVENLDRYKAKVVAKAKADFAGADNATRVALVYTIVIAPANAEAETAAINTISAYAGNDNADALTIALLNSAGITGAISANLARYKVAIVNSTASGAGTKEKIQALIDNANEAARAAAVTVIKGYAAIHNASALTIDKLAEAGVPTDTTLGTAAAIAANLASYKTAIAAKNPEEITEASLKTIIKLVNEDVILKNEINKVIGYADSDNANDLTIAQLKKIVGEDPLAPPVIEANLAAYKAAVVAKIGTDVNTKEKIVNLVKDVNNLVGKLTSFKDFTGAGSVNLTIANLTELGITGTLVYNLVAYQNELNAKAAADVDTVAKIQKIINDVNTAQKSAKLNDIISCAADDNTGKFNLSNNELIKALVIIGITNAKVEYEYSYVSTIANLASGDVDTVAKVQAVVNSINKSEALKAIRLYAGNDDATFLTISQLQDAGVVGAKTENLAYYIVKIADATLDEVSTLEKIQVIIDLANAEADQENAEKAIAAINAVSVGTVQGSIPAGSSDKLYLPVLAINVTGEVTVSAASFVLAGESTLTLYTDSAFSAAVGTSGATVASNTTLYAKVVSQDGKNIRYYKVVYSIVDTTVKRYEVTGTDFVKVGSNFKATVTVDRGNAAYLANPKLLCIYTLSDGQTQVYITQNAVMGENSIVVGAGITKVKVVLVDGEVDWTDPNSPNTKSLFVSLNFPASN